MADSSSTATAETSGWSWGELITAASNIYGSKTQADIAKDTASAALATATAQSNAAKAAATGQSNLVKYLIIGGVSLVGLLIVWKVIAGRK